MNTLFKAIVGAGLSATMILAVYTNREEIQEDSNVKLLYTSELLGRIHNSMKEEKVRRLLQKPADYEYHPWTIVVRLRPLPGTDPEWEKIWVDEKDNAIIIHFDTQGNVINKAIGGFSWE